MTMFDKKGIMLIPVPAKKQAESKEQIVIKSCYCQNGHSLISKRARFNEYDGILLGVRSKDQMYHIAVSPVFGEKIRVSLDIDLVDGELLDLVCPECGVNLPVYAVCECGGVLKVMFLSQDADFLNCVGVCNRVGCRHSEIKNEGQLMTLISGE